MDTSAGPDSSNSIQLVNLIYMDIHYCNMFKVIYIVICSNVQSTFIPSNISTVLQ